MSRLAAIVQESDELVDAEGWDAGFAAGFAEGGNVMREYIMGEGKFRSHNDLDTEVLPVPVAEDYIGDYIRKRGRN